MISQSIDRALTTAIERIDLRDYRGALIALDSIGTPNADGDIEIADRITLDVLRGECYAFLGRTEEALSLCGPAVSKLRTGDLHGLYARACFVMAAAQFYLGSVEDAIDNCNLSIFTYMRIEDAKGWTRSLNWLGNIYFAKSDYAHALSSYQRCAQLAKSNGLDRAVAVSRDNMSRVNLLVGDLRAATSCLQGNRETLLRLDERLNVVRHDLTQCYRQILGMDFEGARSGLLALSTQAAGMTQRDHGVLCEYMGELELSCGNLSEAERHLHHGIEIATGVSRDESVIGQSRRLLAEVRVAQERLDDAMAEGERALISIRRVGEHFEEGVVYRLFGDVHARRGNSTAARNAYGRSIDTLRTIGARLEWAKSALAVGRCEAFSRRERLSNLLEAERLFREVGIEYWITETEGELAQITEVCVAKPAASAKSAVKRLATVFITEDRETRETVQMAERLARTNLVVLITGETGAGKDRLAAHIHSVSSRANKPFVEIDLSTIPDSLWESELFGHRRGAYTGASSDKVGLFESANGGTVFLNEIGNLPSHMQVKLLEFLDTRQIRRIGDNSPTTLDIRLIAATNTPLRDAVKRGVFRSDLLHRLEEAPLHLRPLRERRADILPLVRHFLREAEIDDAEIASIEQHSWIHTAREAAWPGNTRQLRNFVLRLAGVAERPSHPEFESWAIRLLEQMRVNERVETSAAVTPERLREALDRSHGNQRAAARSIGITEAGVRHLIRRFGIPRFGDGDEAGEKVAA